MSADQDALVASALEGFVPLNDDIDPVQVFRERVVEHLNDRPTVLPPRPLADFSTLELIDELRRRAMLDSLREEPR